MLFHFAVEFKHSHRVVRGSRLLEKITAYLVSIGRLLCLAFLYRWCFLYKISLDWPSYFDNSAVYFKTFGQPWVTRHFDCKVRALHCVELFSLGQQVYYFSFNVNNMVSVILWTVWQSYIGETSSFFMTYKLSSL